MRTSMRNRVLGVLCLSLLLLSTVSASGAAGRWQETEDEERRVKRISIGRSPCVFISSSRQRGTLGVHLMDLTPELRTHFGAPADAGVIVSKVLKDSPAAKAGIEVGDILTAIDGEEVSTSREVARTIRRKSEGDVVEVELRRNRSSKKVNATIEERQRSEINLAEVVMEDCDEFDFDVDVQLDEESIREAVEDATRHFRSPEWRSHWRWLERFDDESLQEKLKELEERLKELEKELEEKEWGEKDSLN
jgi:hypothetical protein